jgi:zinc D-Ala-D-Ala carboxypeptidase
MTSCYPSNISRKELLDSDTAVRYDISNEPESEEHEKNLLALAWTAQELRDRLSEHFDKICYIIISSGYRSPTLNELINGSKRSAHPHGFAMDFRVPGLNVKDIVEFIHEFCQDLEFDQCIDEFGQWTHFAIERPNTGEKRKQFLVAYKNSKRKTAYKTPEYLSDV